MATKIITKNSSTASAVPLAADLVQGELAVNVTDKKLYTKNNAGTVVSIGDTPSIVDNGNATAITIDSSENVSFAQNVGIGTSSPTGKLQVKAANPQIWMEDSAGGTNGKFTAIGTSNGAMTFNRYLDNGTLAGEWMRIDSSGNLLVGQTATLNSNSNSMSFSPSNALGVFNHASGVVSGSEYTRFCYNATTIGSITQNGTTGVLYNLTSDYRLKNDPQPLTGAKEFVMALQPKKWQWWDGSGEGVGFIAHEFMEVAKYSGNGEKDAVDVDGNPVYQSIQSSSSEVMANLVALLQEQQAIITQLQADVASLKGN